MNSGASVALAVLAALSRYRGADRLYALEVEGLDADLVVERWQGRESLSSGFEWQVDALSTDAHLPLEDWLGKRATLTTRGARGESIPRSGLVREAECIGSDGGLARYRLRLVPWTWLLTRGRHSRVFQNRAVIDIVEAVLAGYAPLARWRIGDEVGPFLKRVRPRSYCVQYRESDFAFVSRLLAEEGLGWRLHEAVDAPASHAMMIFANSGDGPRDASDEAGGGIRFHRADAAESSDTVQALGTMQAIGSTALSLLSHDYQGAVIATQISLADAGGDAGSLEVYDPSGAYAFASQGEASRHASLLGEAREAERRCWLGRSTVRSFRPGHWFEVIGTPLADDASAALLLTSVQQAGVNNLPDAVREQLASLQEAEIPAQMPSPVSLLDGVSDSSWAEVLASAEKVGYANAFTAVPRELPWRPVLHDGTGALLNPRPTALGYQSALVVGEAGAAQSPDHELHSDALGRIRVRFHFQSAGQEGATANDSCWLRVSQRYAGPGVGSQFLPRIGQEVLVGFLDGDIDRPLVVGALYNGHGEGGIAPTPGGVAAAAHATDLFAQATDQRPSAQGNRAGGNAPPWHGMSGDADGHRNAAALSGFKSKEFGGSGHNRLVFDDSDGQLRLQLATTHAASELNLGHLVHQADNYRGSFRGEGFELRTDRWGAVRGERGLWISAYGNGAEAPAGEHVAATALIRQATQLADVFNEAAGTHVTVRLAAHQGEAGANQSRLIDGQSPLKALLTSASTVVAGSGFETGRSEARARQPDVGEHRVPHSGDAILGLTAPAGIGFVAGASLHWSVGETLTVASGQASNAAIAGDLRIHAGQAIGWLAGAVEGNVATAHALALVTGEGELDLQAQQGQLKLQSRDQLTVTSANAEVELAAGKTVHLATSGGASITIEGGNIRIACPGTIIVHAAAKSFLGAAKVRYPLPVFPQSVCKECLVLAAQRAAPFTPKG